MYTNVFEAKANAKFRQKKSPLPFPLPLPKKFSLPLPLPFGSEKATPANAYSETLFAFADMLLLLSLLFEQ
jgi:hypothetical protein